MIVLHPGQLRTVVPQRGADHGMGEPAADDAVVGFGRVEHPARDLVKPAEITREAPSAEEPHAGIEKLGHAHVESLELPERAVPARPQAAHETGFAVFSRLVRRPGQESGDGELGTDGQVEIGAGRPVVVPSADPLVSQDEADVGFLAHVLADPRHGVDVVLYIEFTEPLVAGPHEQ